jgi:heme-degrading monooxygenase HmoA/predicted ester cyclase
MHARINMLAGDPAQLNETTRYVAGTVQPHVEGQPGSRGVACLANADLGTCVIASYWDSLDAMTASEQVVQVSRKEIVERLRASVAVEHYDVPVFVRRTRPPEGAWARLARIDCAAADMDSFTEEFRTAGIPALMEMNGLCSAHLMTDQSSRRCIVVTAWQDRDALAASRAATARLRADAAGVTHIQIRGVEEYQVMFSSVREGDTRHLIEREVELWNARDRDGWMSCQDLHRLDIEAPGGIHMSGREAAESLWSAWQGAFPDNRLETTVIHADGRGGVHEGRFIGTHTGVLRGPAGELPPTGQKIDGSFCGVYEFEEGKISSYHLFFDQVDLLTQLGITTAAG